MGKVSALATGAIAAGLLFSATPSFAAVTVGTVNPFGANCTPFSCAGRYSVTEYQQAYNSAAFPAGATSFNQISFNAAAGYAGDVMDPATYAISFYLTPSTTLSTDLASNEGTLLGTFGTFTLGGSLPSTLSLTGSTIDYDPSLGKLLMDVTITGASTATGTLGYFAGELNGGNLSAAYDYYRGSVTNHTGLVTTFSAAVPEPASWAMMLFGFAGIGTVVRRRRRAALPQLA